MNQLNSKEIQSCLHLRNSVTKNKGIQRKYMETKGIIKKFNLYPNSEQQYRELKEAFERIEKPYTNTKTRDSLEREAWLYRENLQRRTVLKKKNVYFSPCEIR